MKWCEAMAVGRIVDGTDTTDYKARESAGTVVGPKHRCLFTAIGHPMEGVGAV
jgi:hypothetical protein